ncbi:PilW family protein [Ectothiorhodospira shaposhnikovii]|uniref:PilW family protein n=1 Tax=Ectothiorhodospira shaposhnikovii TaxID=1054 RepID=UPI001EE91AF3|nr:prepilin-type N-terminal cleavage/methylation domain-containing protein [Ectothiorhodospira shaposhnikovii]MCG5513803.1 prepilin-type N-terminal cleavage/methylation domain-containing protein [Ectothiorhodospira shaposhnikovii]
MSAPSSCRIPLPRQSGLSLVELMVAMVLGLLLLAGVIQVFLGNQTTYRETQRLAALQEAIGYGVDFMVRDIRGAIALEVDNGMLRVTRDRDLAWCGVDAGVGDVFYYVAAGGLRCGDGATQNHELVPGLKDGSMVIRLIPEDNVPTIGVRISLVFESRSAPGQPVHEHPVQFHVALRNALLPYVQ